MRISNTGGLLVLIPFDVAAFAFVHMRLFRFSQCRPISKERVGRSWNAGQPFFIFSSQFIRSHTGLDKRFSEVGLVAFFSFSVGDRGFPPAASGADSGRICVFPRRCLVGQQSPKVGRTFKAGRDPSHTQ